MFRTFIMLVTFCLASPALADFAKVQSEAEFVRLVSGKVLTRPLVKLEVSESGAISGTGATWAISGDWSWKDGYFCRSLEWGGDDLGYDCQEVTVSAGKVRFTSEQGNGDSADFRLR